MLRALALALAVAALVAVPAAQAQRESFQSRIEPLSGSLRNQLTGRFWRAGCPVPLSDLRLLTVSIYGFDGRVRDGQLIVNRDVAGPLRSVFRQPWPEDGDVSGSFHCREAVPSPCAGGRGTGSWSQHAYGRAVDLNPIENPYFGCGRVHDPRSRPFVKRTPLRRGMVTPAVVRAFRSIGWGWGGDWSRGTKDWMHFSATGR